MSRNKNKYCYNWKGNQQKENIHNCAYKGCTKEGTHKASISPDKIGQYQYLCLQHIKEHNKNWNFFSGMSEDEISIELERARMRGYQTTPMGVRLAAKKINFNPDKMKDPFELFNRTDFYSQHIKDNAQEIWPDITDNERKAMSVLDLSPPFTIDELRKNYRKFAITFHPDSNAHNEEYDDEMIKKVNAAYDILKQRFKQ